MSFNSVKYIVSYQSLWNSTGKAKQQQLGLGFISQIKHGREVGLWPLPAVHLQTAAPSCLHSSHCHLLLSCWIGAWKSFLRWPTGSDNLPKAEAGGEEGRVSRGIEGQRGSQGMSVVVPPSHTASCRTIMSSGISLGRLRGFPTGEPGSVSLTETIFEKNRYLHQAECSQL